MEYKPWVQMAERIRNIRSNRRNEREKSVSRKLLQGMKLIKMKKGYVGSQRTRSIANHAADTATGGGRNQDDALYRKSGLL